MNRTIKRELESLQGWVKLKDGMEIAEFECQSAEWKKPRRMVAVRKNIDMLPKATMWVYCKVVPNYNEGKKNSNLVDVLAKMVEKMKKSITIIPLFLLPEHHRFALSPLSIH